MKNKWIYGIVICIFIALGLIVYFMLNTANKTTSSITEDPDMTPSTEVNISDTDYPVSNFLDIEYTVETPTQITEDAQEESQTDVPISGQNNALNPMLLDANQDGEISLDEAQGDLLTNFDMFDLDGNGSISENEINIILAMEDTETATETQTQATTNSQSSALNPMLLDANQDGEISLEEAQGELLTNFDMFDLDGNGTISEGEINMIMAMTGGG